MKFWTTIVTIWVHIRAKKKMHRVFHFLHYRSLVAIHFWTVNNVMWIIRRVTYSEGNIVQSNKDLNVAFENMLIAQVSSAGMAGFDIHFCQNPSSRLAHRVSYCVKVLHPNWAASWSYVLCMWSHLHPIFNMKYGL